MHKILLNSEKPVDSASYDLLKREFLPLPEPPYNLRKPKRSTLGALEALLGWESYRFADAEVPAGTPPKTEPLWHQPEIKVKTTYHHRIQRHTGGWVAVTPDQNPLPKTWVPVKGLESIVDASAGVRTLKAFVDKGNRIWAGQCKKCSKYTLATSQYFLRKGKCVHCHPPLSAQDAPKGRNLFIAGNNPLGHVLHLVTANSKETAEKIALGKGYAWVVPAYASQRGRDITLPASPDPADRPNDCWAFPIGDTPLGFTQATKTWQGPDNREWAWFKQPTPTEVLEEQAAAQAKVAIATNKLVDFDDFM